jgi:hypothetical protein
MSGKRKKMKILNSYAQCLVRKNRAKQKQLFSWHDLYQHVSQNENYSSQKSVVSNGNKKCLKNPVCKESLFSSRLRGTMSSMAVPTLCLQHSSWL